MKQIVNLYQPVLYPVRQRYTLRRLTLGLTGLTALCLVIWLLLAQQQRQAVADFTAAEQMQAQQQQELQVYQQALQQRKPDAELMQQFTQLQHDIVQQQQLLQYLSQQQQQASEVYSPVLQHLQQIDSSALWLTSFELQQHSSSFNGIALQPVSITRWLEELRQSAYFRGQRFSQVNMTQVPQRTAVSFELSAQQGAEE